MYRKIKTPCRVSPCPHRASAPHTICNVHRDRLRFYGHVKGRHIHRRESKPYLKLAERFWRLNASHPASVIALDEMKQLLTPGPEPRYNKRSPHYQLWRELTRLHKAGVTPERALLTCLALYMLSEEQPAVLPGDRRFQFAVARSLFFLAEYNLATSHWDHATQTLKKRAHVPGSLASEGLGKLVMGSVGVYMLKAARHILTSRYKREPSQLSQATAAVPFHQENQSPQSKEM